MNYEFEKTCRICLKEYQNLISIFSHGDRDTTVVSISQKIMACAAIQISPADGLPSMICSKCVGQLGIAYIFIEMCQSSDATLKKYIKSVTPIRRLGYRPVGTNSIKNADASTSKITLRSEDSESNSFLELSETQLQEDDTMESTCDSNIYDFIKVSCSDDDKTNHDDPSDSDTPLSLRQQKSLKKKAKEKKRSKKIRKKFTETEDKRMNREDKDVECPVCHRTFAYMCVLKDHMVQHTGARPYLCSVCGKSFSHTTSLTNHMKTHYSEKTHKCDQCELSFHRRAHLILHMRTHTKEKPFVCDVCGRDFAQNSYLREHKRIHSGEKPFVCDVCGHGFARKSCLIMHKRVHTGELPYECPECGRAFSQRSQRKRHVKKNHKNSALLRETGELILKDVDVKNKLAKQESIRNNVNGISTKGPLALPNLIDINSDVQREAISKGSLNLVSMLDVNSDIHREAIAMFQKASSLHEFRESEGLYEQQFPRMLI